MRYIRLWIIFILFLLSRFQANEISIQPPMENWAAHEDSLYTLAIVVDMDSSNLNGIGCYFEYNSQLVEIIDQYPETGIQPFLPWNYFNNGVILSNQILEEGMLAYAEGSLSATTPRSDTLCLIQIRITGKTTPRDTVSFGEVVPRISSYSLRNGHTYYFETSAPFIYPIAPTGPSQLTVLDAPRDNGGIVRLQWQHGNNPSGFIQGYRIYRKSPGADAFNLIKQVSATTTTITDSVQVSHYNDTLWYEYQVKAYHNWAESGNTQSVRAFGMDNQPTAFQLNSPTDRYRITLPLGSAGQLFSWSASMDPDGQLIQYIFEVAIDSFFTNLLKKDTTNLLYYSYTPPAYENQLFFWRITAQDPEGMTRLCDQWRSFYLDQIASAPTTPTSIAPRYAALVEDSFPTFSWHRSWDPDPLDSIIYQLTISDAISLEGGYQYQLTSDTFFQITTLLADDKAYYWRISAIDRSLQQSSSNIDSFYLNYHHQAPSSFTILTPTDGQFFNQTSIPIRYHHATDVDILDTVRYCIRWDMTWPFTEVDSIITADTQAILTLGDNQTYYLTVTAYDRYGLYTDATPDPLYFFLDQFNLSPREFNLLSPDSATSYREGEVFFSWQRAQDEDPGDTIKYRILWGRSSGLMSTWMEGITDTFSVMSLAYLQEDQKNYWTVEAYDSFGGKRTANQNGWYFYKNLGNNSPQTFQLLTPVTYSAVTNAHPTFSWDKAVDSDPDDQLLYTWYLKDSTNSIILDSAGGLQDTFYNFTKNTLLENHLYAWDVQVHDQQNAIAYALQPNFFYLNAVNQSPLGFDLVAPATDSVLKQQSVTFRWKKTSDPDPGDAVSYTLQFSLTPYFDASFDTLTTDTTITISSAYFITDTIYYWRVIARDQEGLTRSCNQSFFFYIDTHAPSFHFYLAQNANFPHYVKLFTQSTESLKQNPTILINGSPVDVQQTDANYYLYFTSINFDTISTQALQVKATGADRVGNQGTLEQTLIIMAEKNSARTLLAHSIIKQVENNATPCYLQGPCGLADDDKMTEDPLWIELHGLQSEIPELLITIDDAYTILPDSETLLPIKPTWMGTHQRLKQYLLRGNGRYQLKKETQSETPILSNQDCSISTFPNPFTDHLTIELKLSRANQVSFELFTINGIRIGEIYSGYFNAGAHTIHWKPQHWLPSGVYILIAGQQHLFNKILYLK